ncbi:MAG: hypothetical protein RIC55_30825 [Pirellulaceae bacterium]
MSISANRLSIASRCLAAIAVVAAATLAAPPALQAAPPKNALSLVPADAGIFVSVLRNKQQYDDLMGSRWMARLKKMPAVQQAWSEFLDKWQAPDGEFEKLHAFLADPDNKELSELGLRLTHDEVFLYGDSRLADIYSLYQQASWAGNFAMYEAMASGDFFAGDPNSIMFRAWGDTLLKNLDRVAVPKLLIGMKIQDDDIPVAQKQLDRLAAARELLGIAKPELKERMRKVEIGGSSFWTLELEGTDMDWDAMPLAALAGDPDYKPLADKIKSLRTAISIGVHKGYLLLSVAASNDYLATLGDGMLLVDQAEFAAYRQLEDKPLTSVAFVSAPFQASQSYLTHENLEMFADRGKQLVDRLPVGFDEKRQMQADIEELKADLKPLCAELGPVIGYSYRTDFGYEGFAYDWTKHPGAKPMGKAAILDHVGESPLLLIAAQSSVTVEGYEKYVKWASKLRGYIEQYGLANATPEQRTQYATIVDTFTPIAVKFDALTREKFLPALADSQMAVLVDGGLSDKQWSEALPPSDEPVPLPQPGFAATVKDGDVVAECIDDYRRLINDAIVQWRALSPESAPKFLLPDPRQQEVANGKVYSFSLPEEWAASPRLRPNYGVSNKVLAISAAPETTNSLLGKKSAGFGRSTIPLDETVVSVVHFDVAGLVDAVVPWIAIGQQLSGEELDEEQKQVMQDVVSLVRCIRSATVITRLEGDVLVAHQQLHLTDLPDQE